MAGAFFFVALRTKIVCAVEYAIGRAGFLFHHRCQWFVDLHYTICSLRSFVEFEKMRYLDTQTKMGVILRGVAEKILKSEKYKDL